MPQKQIIKIINELNRQIKLKFNDFQGLYLYGSQARGTSHKYSDIDMVALFNNINRDKQLELCKIINELNYKYNVIIELFTYTDEGLRKNPVFYDEVVNKGQFYAA